MPRIADPNAKIALLASAESVFAEKGVDAAKVEDIARGAGLSKGAFYLHFESKEEALRQVCESFLAHCNAAFRPPEEAQREAPLPTEPREALAFWFEKDVNFYELLWQGKSTVAILHSCQGPQSYLLEAFRRRVLETSRSWIAFLRARGFFRPDVDDELTSHLIFGAYDELAHKMLACAKRPPIERWLRHTQTLFVRGLGAPVFVAALDEAHDAEARRQRTSSPRISRAKRAAHRRRAR